MDYKTFRAECKWCKKPILLKVEANTYKRFDSDKPTQYHHCKGFKEMTPKETAGELF